MGMIIFEQKCIDLLKKPDLTHDLRPDVPKHLCPKVLGILGRSPGRKGKIGGLNAPMRERGREGTAKHNGV